MERRRCSRFVRGSPIVRRSPSSSKPSPAHFEIPETWVGTPSLGALDSSRFHLFFTRFVQCVEPSTATLNHPMLA